MMLMENPFDVADNDVEELADLRLSERVRLLRMITDYRLSADDIPELLKAGFRIRIHIRSVITELLYPDSNLKNLSGSKCLEKAPILKKSYR